MKNIVQKKFGLKGNQSKFVKKKMKKNMKKLIYKIKQKVIRINQRMLRS